MGPRRVLDTKTYWLTDRQSQYDFDFEKSVCEEKSTRLVWDDRQPRSYSAKAMGYLPTGKDAGTEYKESPSVGSVTSQRLVETVTDWENYCVCNSELYSY
jgi:hypothetical protein